MKLPEGIKIDPRSCPACGATDSFEEIGSKASTQGCSLVECEDGSLKVGEWHEWSVGDETDEGGFQCSECLRVWSLIDLEESMRQRAVLVWISERISECAQAIDRPPIDSELYARIRDCAFRNGSRLDPRALDRADPQPFLEEQFDIIDSTLSYFLVSHAEA